MNSRDIRPKNVPGVGWSGSWSPHHSGVAHKIYIHSGVGWVMVAQTFGDSLSVDMRSCGCFMYDIKPRARVSKLPHFKNVTFNEIFSVLQSILPLSHVASVLTSNIHTLSNTSVAELTPSRKSDRKKSKCKTIEPNSVSSYSCFHANYMSLKRA